MNRMFHSLVLTTVALLAFGAVAEAQPAYTITHIGPIPVDFTVPRYGAIDLNDKGEVTGSYMVPNGIRAFLWRDGEFTEIPPVNGDPFGYIEAFAINNRSQVIGSSGFRPFIWQNGVGEDMGYFPGEFGIFPWHANDRGQTVGTLATGEDRYYISSGSTAVVLEPLSGHEGTLPSAGDISNLGVATGVSGPAGARRAAVWFAGSAKAYPLNVLPGVTDSAAGGLNDWGQILVSQALPQGRRMTVWTLGRYTIPRGLRGEDVATSGFDINNAGQILGLSYDSTTGTNEYTIWDEGTAYRVKDLIAASDPSKPYVTLMSVRRINNAGQLLAEGIDSRGNGSWMSFLLSPVETP
jgi:uncharacterized membrane protein